MHTKPQSQLDEYHNDHDSGKLLILDWWVQFSTTYLLRTFIRRHASLWTSKVTQKGSDVHRIIIQLSNISMDQHQATTMSTTAFHGQKIWHMIKSILIQKMWRDLYKFELLCTLFAQRFPLARSSWGERRMWFLCMGTLLSKYEVSTFWGETMHVFPKWITILQTKPRGLWNKTVKLDRMLTNICTLSDLDRIHT